MLCLPSHTSHLLQPLDVGVFRSLKSFFSKACKQFMAAKPGRVVRSEDLASLLAIAWPQSVTPVNIMSGFCKCGIYPLNPGVIDDRQTAPSKATCALSAPLQSPSESGDSSSQSNSTKSSPESGLTIISPLTNSECSEGSAGQHATDYLSEVLILPVVKANSTSSGKSVNTDAVCITNTSFVEQMKQKEAEKTRKQEEMEKKRIEREQKREKREEAKKRRQKMKNKRKARVKDDEDCICPICNVNFEEDEENVSWISCDKCFEWWHVDCLQLTAIPENYFCTACSDC